MRVIINGEERSFTAPHTLHSLLAELGVDPGKVAVERNLEIVPRSNYGAVPVNEGDRLEIVHFIGGGAGDEDGWEVAGRTFHSRLLVGTGKYKDFEETARAIEASGARSSPWRYGG